MGKVIADGRTEYANQGKPKAGTVLYRIVWHNYPPDMVWYEPKDNLGAELKALVDFEARIAAEAAEAAAAAEEEAKLTEMEAEESLPGHERGRCGRYDVSLSRFSLHKSVQRGLFSLKISGNIFSLEGSYFPKKFRKVSSGPSPCAHARAARHPR